MLETPLGAVVKERTEANEPPPPRDWRLQQGEISRAGLEGSSVWPGALSKEAASLLLKLQGASLISGKSRALHANETHLEYYRFKNKNKASPRTPFTLQ